MCKDSRGITRFLIRRVISQPGMQTGTRNAKLGAIEGWTSAIISLLLVILKAVLAVFSGSIALLADALNNFGDLAGSMVLIFSYRLSQKPRDADHPYGHGRLRTIAGLILAIILIIVGVEAAKSGLLRIINPTPVTTSTWLLAAIGASILLKAWLANFARTIARVTEDAALASEAWNHFFDIFSTGLVLVALICARYDLPSVDGWAGILISGFIIYTGIRYVRETVGILLGSAPKDEDVRSVRRMAEEVAGVLSVHDIQIHEYGNMRLISLHVEMDASASAIECHALTEKVENSIAGQYDAKVIVHGDPVDTNHPEYRNISSVLNNFISSNKSFVDFHDLRIEGGGSNLVVAVDLVTSINVGSEDFPSKAEEAYKFVTTHVVGIGRFDVGIETSYASDPEFRKIYESSERHG